MPRGFLTIAYGPPRYIRMAKALARSMRLHSNGAPLAIVTDRSSGEFTGLADYLIPVDTSFGSGVSQKLHLDKYTPFDETLFIDSDCIVYSNPNQLWDSYARAHGFGVKGWRYLGTGDHHEQVDDMREYLARYGVERLAAFNGGIYYFDRSTIADRVFETARRVYSERDAAGLRPFKNSPVADEPVIALAMEIHGVEMLPWEDGRAMNTALGVLHNTLKINVLTGASAYDKNGRRVEPIVIHYNVQCQDSYVYRRELHRLALPSWAAPSLSANVTVLPEFLLLKLSHYFTRATSRVKARGLLGLIPERFSITPPPWRSRRSTSP